MKTVLYMAISANGMIAAKNDDVSFVSKASWKWYSRKVRQSDAVIIGRRTYHLMPVSEFQPKTQYFVLTRKRHPTPKVSNVHFTSESPKKLIRKLKRQGLRQVCICGGAKLNASMLSAGLIDELFLDVMPTLLSDGIPLFAHSASKRKLKPLSVKKIAANEVQLHYRVMK